MNNTRKSVLINSLTAAAGLFLFAIGVYLTIRADIGVAPWDVFNIGLANTLGITYGTANIIISLTIVVIDVLLKEKIGIGMLLDALLVGKFVDFLNFLDLIPYQTNIIKSIPVMFLGMVVLGYSQYFYMKAALGCGPRDTLLVGLKRRTKRIPIGIVSVLILSAATFVGWLLGGPIGIGTLICAFLEGPIMELAFRTVHYDATSTKHQDILTSMRIVFKRKS